MAADEMMTGRRFSVAGFDSEPGRHSQVRVFCDNCGEFATFGGEGDPGASPMQDLLDWTGPAGHACGPRLEERLRREYLAGHGLYPGASAGGPRGRVYRDPQGDLWLDPGDLNGEVLALDEPVLRRLREKWPSRPRAEIEAEFGALRELLPQEPE